MQEIKIIAPKGMEIDKENSTFECIKFKPIQKLYPLSAIEALRDKERYYINPAGVVDYTNGCRSINDLASEKLAKAFLALMQLKTLCNAWNKMDSISDKYYPWCIIKANNESIKLAEFSSHRRVLSFYKKETAELFFNIFKPLIEEAQELI